jgi:hypothetical protein
VARVDLLFALLGIERQEIGHGAHADDFEALGGLWAD